MTTFAEMYNRVATELRRSNLIAEAKQAVNDAITTAAKNRFYFNQMRGVTFPTVAAQEYYPDMGLVDIDAIWYMTGVTRRNLFPVSNAELDCIADGNPLSGQMENYARSGMNLRFYPIPSNVTAIYADGYGKLSPSPLTDDADTNNWLTEGEQYIRALAKSYLLRDIIKDYQEAQVYNAIAEDYKHQLDAETGQRMGTNTIRPTRW